MPADVERVDADRLLSRAEIAAELGVSHERVRQLEVAALEKLSAALRERLGETGYEQLRGLLRE